MHNCPLCTKTFKTSTNLNHHLVSHTKEKPDKCPKCPQVFGQKSQVKTHIKIVHDGIKQTRNNNHHCSMCSYKCDSKSSLQVHVRKHSAELPFSCHRPGCGYRTKYKSSLSQHALQAHSDKRPIKCQVDGCSYKAKTRADIRKHLRVHSNDKPFVCTVPGCNYTFKSKLELKRHCSTVHSNSKPFKCSACDFQTKYGVSLRHHQLTHTNMKRFQCQAPDCSFASYTKNHLKVHFDRKHRKKNVICTESRCNFTCGSVALLRKHLKLHKLPILKCPDDSCDFSTIYNHSLVGHISRRHKGFQTSVRVVGKSMSDLKTAETMSTLHCSFTDCNYATTFPHHFDRHVITHKKEDKGQHPCSFCCSRFSSLSLLKSHVKRHREKPYACALCSYTTMGSFRLKCHARKIHQIHILIPHGKDDQFIKCVTCGRNCFSYGESVLHSMSHLQPVVVLEQLQLHVL